MAGILWKIAKIGKEKFTQRDSKLNFVLPKNNVSYYGINGKKNDSSLKLDANNFCFQIGKMDKDNETLYTKEFVAWSLNYLLKKVQYGATITLQVRSDLASVLKNENDNKYKILTDIQGPEDHHGDMDFKIAGTRQGVTAIQLDVKVEGVPVKILGEALSQAKSARLTILDAIEKEIPAPRANISPNAPEILIIKINPDKIGMVIGGGGKTIKEIMEKSGAEITIEDDGRVYLTGKAGAAEKAKAIIEEMTHEFKVGEVLKGEVVKIADFGAFVALNPFTDGMVHISELAPFRVERVSDIIKEGMIVPVRIISVDSERGKIGLSIKAADSSFFKQL